MQLAPARYLEAVSGVCLLYTQADIGIQLFVETFTKVSGCYELAFAAG